MFLFHWHLLNRKQDIETYIIQNLSLLLSFYKDKYICLEYHINKRKIYSIICPKFKSICFLYVYAVFFRAIFYHLFYRLNVFPALVNSCKSFLTILYDIIDRLFVFITDWRLFEIDWIFHLLRWLDFSLLDTIFFLWNI